VNKNLQKNLNLCYKRIEEGAIAIVLKTLSPVETMEETEQKTKFKDKKKEIETKEVENCVIGRSKQRVTNPKALMIIQF